MPSTAWGTALLSLIALVCLAIWAYGLVQDMRPLPPAGPRAADPTRVEIPDPSVPLSASVLGLPTNPDDDTLVQRIVRRRVAHPAYVGRHRVGAPDAVVTVAELRAARS